jgi:Domain of unknown function (DUF4398)
MALLGRSKAALVALSVLCSLTVGCGPALYTAGIRSAEQKLQSARDENARWYAPYEYYFAEAHLQQAREEAAQASYEDAVRYAKTARDYGERALEITRQRRKAER